MKSKTSTTRDTSASRPLICDNGQSQSWPSCLKSSHVTHTQSVSMRTKMVEKAAEENAVPVQAGRVARHTSNLGTAQNRCGFTFSETAETTESTNQPCWRHQGKDCLRTPSQKLRSQVHPCLQPMNPTPVLFQPRANTGRHMWCPPLLVHPLHNQRRLHTTCPSVSSSHTLPPSVPWSSA